MAKKRIERKYGGGKASFTEIATGENFEVDIETVFPGFRKAVAKLDRVEILCNPDGESRDAASMMLNNLIGDAAADPAKPMVAQMQSRLDALLSGTWSSRGAGGSGSSRATLLHEALVRYVNDENFTLESAAEHIEGLSEDELKGLKAHPSIKTLTAQIRAERAAAKAEETAKAAEGAEELVIPIG